MKKIDQISLAFLIAYVGFSSFQLCAADLQVLPGADGFWMPQDTLKVWNAAKIPGVKSQIQSYNKEGVATSQETIIISLADTSVSYTREQLSAGKGMVIQYGLLLKGGDRYILDIPKGEWNPSGVFGTSVPTVDTVRIPSLIKDMNFATNPFLGGYVDALREKLDSLDPKDPKNKDIILPLAKLLAARSKPEEGTGIIKVPSVESQTITFVVNKTGFVESAEVKDKDGRLLERTVNEFKVFPLSEYRIQSSKAEIAGSLDNIQKSFVANKKKVFGLVVNKKENHVMVGGVLPDSPASKKGFKEGMEIDSINGKNVSELSLAELNKLFNDNDEITVSLKNPQKEIHLVKDVLSK